MCVHISTCVSTSCMRGENDRRSALTAWRYTLMLLVVMTDYQNRILAGLRKQPDGTWKDYIIMDSSDLPPGLEFPMVDAFAQDAKVSFARHLAADQNACYVHTAAQSKLWHLTLDCTAMCCCRASCTW